MFNHIFNRLNSSHLFWSLVGFGILLRLFLSWNYWELSLSFDAHRYYAQALTILSGSSEILHLKYPLSYYPIFLSLAIATVSKLFFLSVFNAGKLLILVNSVLFIVIAAKIIWKQSDLIIPIKCMIILFLCFQPTMLRMTYTETLELQLLVLSVLFLYLIMNGSVFSLIKLLMLGLIVGFSYLARPEGIVLIVLLFYAIITNHSLKLASFKFSVSLLAMMLIILPYSILLYYESGAILSPGISQFVQDSTQWESMLGNSPEKYIRNLIDNLIWIWPVILKDGSIILLFFSIISFFMAKKNKLIQYSIVLILVFILIHSRVFGASTTLLNNAQWRYFMIYLFPIMILVGFGVQYIIDMIGRYNKSYSRLGLLLILIYIMSISLLNIKRSPPFNWYRNQGAFNRAIGFQLKNNFENSAVFTNNLLIVYGQLNKALYKDVIYFPQKTDELAEFLKFNAEKAESEFIITYTQDANNLISYLKDDWKVHTTFNVHEYKDKLKEFLTFENTSS